jgi:subtilisin family serine protease
LGFTERSNSGSDGAIKARRIQNQFSTGSYASPAARRIHHRNFYPAAYENVTSVAATNQHDERCDDDDWDPYSWYTMPYASNFGDWIDIAAPGNLIYSTMPTYHVWYNNYWNQWRCGGFYQYYYDYILFVLLAHLIVVLIKFLGLFRDR